MIAAVIPEVGIPSQVPSLASYRLQSAFQPVFSLTHGRLVGHEALLRVTDQSGASVPPNVLFDAQWDHASRAALDVQAVRQHLSAYRDAGKFDAPEWLFLNLHPSSLLPASGGFNQIVEAILESGIPPVRLVLEVLESPLFDDESLYEALERLKDMGCLIALDDFGAGHSNFERVFDIRPHIVKLDRKVLLRAKSDLKARRILERMVSLIHECGTLVLVEGVETLAGAHISLTCDADLVQGYYFGKPIQRPLSADDGCTEVDEAWTSFDEAQARVDDRWRESLGAHCDQLQLASFAVAAGTPLSVACAGFLAGEKAALCYLLDDSGKLLADAAFRDGTAQASLGHLAQFEPLHDCANARWSRRQYFRRALSYPGAVQVTRPYLTLQGGWMCFTVSISFELEGRPVVLCGDMRLPSARGTL